MNRPAAPQQLEACPFCGGRELAPGGAGARLYYACKTCNAQGPDGADWESATLQWNTRERAEEQEHPLIPVRNTEKKKFIRIRCCVCGGRFYTTPEVRTCPACTENRRRQGASVPSGNLMSRGGA